jgi:Protein of unknown function DUF262
MSDSGELLPNIEEEAPPDQPIEIEDEYKLSLEAADVEDEALLEQPTDIKFTINSYGADYTVDTLVKRLKTEAFYVPQFQRKFVWSQRHASRFLESLLMGLPVPGIFLYKEPVTNRHLVVDGQQRLRTLQYFYTGTFLENKFRLVGVHLEWNGKTYEELSAADKLKLDDSTVHATIFQQEEPKNSRKSLNLVFDRVNSGGIRLSPQEIRNCVSDGPLLHCIREMNDNETWRLVFGKHRNSRLKDHELILRFLAMHERGDRYARPMRDFLDDFADDFKAAPAPTLERFRALFAQTIKACWHAKGRDAFRPVRSLNAAVFEGVMIGVAARQEKDSSQPEPKEIAEGYDALLRDTAFMRACERATAVEESVRIRRTHAILAFAG